MKKNPLLKLILDRIVFSVVLIPFAFTSCKKDESKAVSPNEKVIENKIEKDQHLIKYLSINLEVEKNEITYNSDSTEFIVRGLHLNKAEIETRYENANVYHTTYGK